MKFESGSVESAIQSRIQIHTLKDSADSDPNHQHKESAKNTDLDI